MDNRVEACPLASDWGLLWQAYMDSKLLPLPGGRRRTGDYDSGVCRVVPPPGMLPQPGALGLFWVAPLSTSSPRRQSVQHRALCCFPATPLPSLRACGVTQTLRAPVAHSSVPTPSVGPRCTTAWLSRCCVLVTLLKLHLRIIKQSLKIIQKGCVKSVMSWLLEHFSRVCGWHVQQVVPVMLKTFSIEP